MRVLEDDEYFSDGEADEATDETTDEAIDDAFVFDDEAIDQTTDDATVEVIDEAFVFDEEVRIDSSDEEAVMEETGGNKKVIESPVRPRRSSYSRRALKSHYEVIELHMAIRKAIREYAVMTICKAWQDAAVAANLGL
jgi:hypothetical protein